jgi:hypothetical protein
LRGGLGRRTLEDVELSAILADLHVFDGRPNRAEPLRLELAFGDGSRLRLGVGGDGATLVVDRLPLEAPVDLGDHGRVEADDLTDAIAPDLRGARVGAPVLLSDRSGRRIGLSLPLAGGEALCFWVDGDRLHWGRGGELAGHDWLPGSEPVGEAPLEP